jgi:hypothetical protein
MVVPNCYQWKLDFQLSKWRATKINHLQRCVDKEKGPVIPPVFFFLPQNWGWRREAVAADGQRLPRAQGLEAGDARRQSQGSLLDAGTQGEPAQQRRNANGEEDLLPFPGMALVHNAGKLKFGAKKRGKKEKSVFEQLDTLELAANGPREHI